MNYLILGLLVIILISICFLVNKLNYVIKKLNHLSQPIFQIDEKSAKIIAERLSQEWFVPKNKYDAICELAKQSSNIEDLYLQSMIEDLSEN